MTTPGLMFTGTVPVDPPKVPVTVLIPVGGFASPDTELHKTEHPAHSWRRCPPTSNGVYFVRAHVCVCVRACVCIGVCVCEESVL